MRQSLLYKSAATALLALLMAFVWTSGCSDVTEEDILGSSSDFEPDRPSTSSDERDVEPYTGDDEHVLEAQRRLADGLDLHRKVIHRTCSPDGGVCHNQQEYPDMHTPSHFFDTIEAPCNVQSDDWESVYDRCEEPGDRFAMQGHDFSEIEIGWVERVSGDHVDYTEEDETPDEDSPGLHIHLRDPIPIDQEMVWDTGQFIRTFVHEGEVTDLPFANFETRWWILDDGTHLFGEVRDYQSDDVNELMSVGIVQGDLNRNGTFGASDSKPLSLLEPGAPEESYLIGRLRGEMLDEDVPGTRMPLANQPLSVPEMLALYCFVEGLEDLDTENLDGTEPIDYESCSYSEDPESLNLLGEGVTWSGRVSHILEANCGGCHSGDEPAEGLDLVEDAYDNILGESTQNPDLNLIEPGSPEESYLWLKITGDDSIEGAQMPDDPVDGERTLTEPELDDIKTWIENGAIDE